MMIMNLKAFLRMNFCRVIYHTGLLHLFLKYVFPRRREFPAVIINYHSYVHTLDDVIEVESSVVHRMETFKNEVRWLRKYFEIVPLDTVVETLSRGKKFARPTVAITIDDGFRDNFELLFPYLKEANLPVTIFLATGFIGTRQRIWIDRVANVFLRTQKTVFTAPTDMGGKQFILDSIQSRRDAYNAVSGPLKAMPIVQRDKNIGLIEDQLGAVPEDKPVMLDWDEVRTMQKGGVHFGAHTRTHPILTSLSSDDARREIADSKKKIEDELQTPVKHFAYPNGRAEDFSEELRQFCRDIGFHSVCAVAMGNNSEPSDIWALKRIGAKLPLSFCAFHMTQAFLMSNHTSTESERRLCNPNIQLPQSSSV